jgi:hypothetical protein
VDAEDTTPKQPFVTAQLEPGEWDMDRTDPYFRPKPPKQSKLISAEDYANRPPVGFDNEFSTYSDAMISLSWLDSKTCRQMYQQYVDMMVLSQQQHNTTSHEYIVRVIAQKYQVQPWRAAGVIQLQHAEEQLRAHHPELLADEQAKYAETTIVQNIRDAYRAERNHPPREPFVEDPVGILGRGEPDETSTEWQSTDDIYDMEQKLEQANVRDAKHARLLIDGHVYKEDVDDTKRPVRTDATAKRLLKAREKQQQSKDTTTTTTTTATTTTTTDKNTNRASKVIPYPENNGKGEKRPRWKYIAKVVNTRALKKKGRRVSTYTNNNMENTLVEHDGDLRVATIAEAHQVAWKPNRRVNNQVIYQGAQQAWLEKTLYGKTDVWGRMPITRASAVEPTVEEEKEEQQAGGEEEAAEVEANAADGGEEKGAAEVEVKAADDGEVAAEVDTKAVDDDEKKETVEEKDEQQKEGEAAVETEDKGEEVADTVEQESKEEEKEDKEK